VLALVAIVFTAVTFLRSGDQEQRAEAADRRALADQVVLTVFDEPKYVEPKNRGPDTPDLKPVPVFTYVVANFGSLPVLDVRLRSSSYLLDLAGEKLRFHDVMDLGTIGPCQVATITNLDLSDPSVEFADANGRRWSRKPAKQPAKVKPPSQAAQGREVVSHGRLAVKELRHCQA
jgi:hypothetical protein